ncbi:hypothetical protein [Actinotalea solisilvae]|uniref:hypothetical protein n=1 Tax=Actinotalea solisilvae TaxID=2072922 RepID=UPI0018F13D2D|nr:hypothetical protein [Actinotalea solisilvae]
MLGAFSGGDPLLVLTVALLPGLYCLTGVALVRRLRTARPPVVSDGSSSLAAWH